MREPARGGACVRSLLATLEGLQQSGRGRARTGIDPRTRVRIQIGAVAILSELVGIFARVIARVQGSCIIV
jgi:hypothetical protein